MSDAPAIVWDQHRPGVVRNVTTAPTTVPVLPATESVTDALAAKNALGYGTVQLGAGTYDIGADRTTLTGSVCLSGVGNDTILLYRGTESALTAIGWDRGVVSNLRIILMDDLANGIELGTATRQSILSNVTVQGTGTATNTGSGWYFNATSAGGAFSGGTGVHDCYSLGNKYGVRFQSADLTVNTWTTVIFTNMWAVGRGVVIPGSSGVYFDALTDGGISWRGGLIEGFDTGIEHLQGGSGGDIAAAIEGCNTYYKVGASFTGRIEDTHTAVTLMQASHGNTTTTPAWFKESKRSGFGPIRESYYGSSDVVYGTSAATDKVGWYRGDSLIEGGSPTLHAAFGLGSSAGDFDPDRTYLQIGANRMAWSSAAPTTGTWSQGDVVWKKTAAAGGPPGWICTTAGTPGTWKAMANVAA